MPTLRNNRVRPPAAPLRGFFMPGAGPRGRGASRAGEADGGDDPRGSNQEANMEHTGIVKWFNERRGYGFIEQIKGPDVFVHHSAIQMDGYRTLAPGTEVEFEVEDSPEGPQARRVSLIDVGV